ncbi:MAG TPA: outer membrane beta-barrel family protein [Bacteroidia bacterium]|nr:outer membrane beta-barrel family protein [Bacteroidia bacterium]
MKTFYSLGLLLIGTILFAQMPSGVSPKMMEKLKDMKIGKVYGKIYDEKSKKPVEYASVVLLWYNKDSVITGTLANEKGYFLIENLPVMASYRVRISFIGYKNYEKRIYITPPDKVEIDLGNIMLSPDETILNEVQVTAEVPTFTTQIDRKVFNVEKDLSVKGGTALDAVKNIPTLNVDADGSVQLRNKGVTIYVDGRPSQLSLDQIPADQIERIEVISNPSVKFDASTTGGILNVVLKKNKKPGYNGMLMGGIGTNDRYNAMGNISVKEYPFNFSLMGTFNSQINYTKGYTKRTDLYNGSIIDYYNQDNHTFNKSQFNFFRVAVDYNLSPRDLITISGNFPQGNFYTSDTQIFSTLLNNQKTFNSGYRVNNSDAGFKGYTGALNYKKSYPTPGKELTFDANYNYFNSKNNYLYNTHTFDSTGAQMFFSPSIQKNNGNRFSNQVTSQLDFTNPVSETKKIEMGLRTNYELTETYNDTRNFSSSINDYVQDTIMSTNYKTIEMINAAYFNFSSKTFWDIKYQLGLRLEQTYFKGTLYRPYLGTSASFDYYYPNSLDNVSYMFFPGIFLSKELSSKSELQFNITRKIKRPNFFQRMPFVMFADNKNIRIGNPGLKPEFTNQAEINHNLNLGKNNIFSTIYFAYDQQPISNTTYPSEKDSSVLVNTFVNGKSEIEYGTEQTVKWTIFKKLNITFNANVYWSAITSDITYKQPQKTYSGWSYTTKLILQYTLPWDINFQINGNYQAPKVIIGGKTIPMYFMDVSLNKMIGTKWNFNLTLSDAFNTKRMGMNTSSDYYIQEISRRREARFLRFTVSYMFGKLDASIFKRRKNNQQQNTNGNADGLDFN